MKTTKKQFELFKKYCLQYQRELNLLDWDLAYEHSKIKSGAYAQAGRSLEDMNGTITFTTDWDDEVDKLNPQNIKETAKHEMLHLLLGQLSLLAQSRYITYREIEIAEHSVINKLVKLIPDV